MTITNETEKKNIEKIDENHKQKKKYIRNSKFKILKRISSQNLWYKNEKKNKEHYVYNIRYIRLIS